MTYMIPVGRANRKASPVRYNGVNRMFDEFFSDMLSPSLSYSRETFKMDIQDNDSSYLVEADLPGVSKNEIKLALEENILTIEVEREQLSEEIQTNYVRKERKLSAMSRSIRLPDVKSEDIDAKLENGVLTVTVPKITKAEKVTQIEIN